MRGVRFWRLHICIEPSDGTGAEPEKVLFGDFCSSTTTASIKRSSVPSSHYYSSSSSTLSLVLALFFPFPFPLACAANLRSNSSLSSLVITLHTSTSTPAPSNTSTHVFCVSESESPGPLTSEKRQVEVEGFQRLFKASAGGKK